MLRKRLHRHRLSYNAGRCNYHFPGINPKSVCRKSADFLCNIHAICVTGIRIFRIDDNRLCSTATGLQMPLCHKDRGALYLILRIYCSSRTQPFTIDHSQIIFGLVRIQTAVQTISGKPYCGAYAAFYIPVSIIFFIHVNPSYQNSLMLHEMPFFWNSPVYTRASIFAFPSRCLWTPSLHLMLQYILHIHDNTFYNYLP